MAPLKPIDLRHDPAEMLGRAMQVEGCSVGPGLQEDEVAGVLLINVELVPDVQWLLSSEVYEFLVERHHRVDRIDANEILGDHFQHESNVARSTDIIPDHLTDLAIAQNGLARRTPT